MRREMLSPEYTTDWNALLRFHEISDIYRCKRVYINVWFFPQTSCTAF
ncbi:DUF4113 domain-containing protein [Klebsiella pneumoniae]|nr:hypothetical protein BANRA_05199 [Klebsiella pneumoniae]